MVEGKKKTCSQSWTEDLSTISNPWKQWLPLNKQWTWDLAILTNSKINCVYGLAKQTNNNNKQYLYYLKPSPDTRFIASLVGKYRLELRCEHKTQTVK